MILAPRYDGPTILQIAGHPSDQLEPLIRQRRRMQEMLADLDEQQWMAASRCAEWTAREVVAHLIGVNSFWHASIRAGLAGTPTRILEGFDPATTPSLMVGQMTTLTTTEMLDQFVSTNEALLDAVTVLTDEQWSTTAESPAGHVSIRLLTQHALWDCWVHERDIVIPLGLALAPEPDELRSCLQYAAAVSPVLGMGLDRAHAGRFGVDATDPDMQFVLDVDESVSVHDAPVPAHVPTLRGDAATLIEALSLRAPMPASTPIEWSALLGGLTTAFDTPQAPR
jgi:uncharacterized protein (TIGR03083 family)